MIFLRRCLRHRRPPAGRRAGSHLQAELALNRSASSAKPRAHRHSSPDAARGSSSDQQVGFTFGKGAVMANRQAGVSFSFDATAADIEEVRQFRSHAQLDVCRLYAMASPRALEHAGRNCASRTTSGKARGRKQCDRDFVFFGLVAHRHHVVKAEQRVARSKETLASVSTSGPSSAVVA